MKTDNYLALCLEQAAKSPLHYKHGSIIVNGGKVIGQGFNDYKPGFNGGALKNGRIAKGAFDGPAIANLKEKLEKQKDKPKQQKQQPQTTFVPFEGTGGGHDADVPLSMHSEMMAVHSALAASSTLSSTAFSCGKPCFKLPRGDKRKARLRREVLASYVKAVCETNQRSGQLQVLHHHDLNNNKQQQECEDLDNEEQDKPVLRMSKEKGPAFHERLSGEKHHHQKKKKEKKNQKEGFQYQHQYQYDRYGQQTQRQSHQSSACKGKKSSLNGVRGYDFTTACDTNDLTMNDSATKQHAKPKKDYKRSGKMKPRDNNAPPQPEPLLIPKGRTGEKCSSLKDRKKHRRLNGADLYVTRLGSCGSSSPSGSAIKSTVSQNKVESAGLQEDLTSSSSSLPSLSTTSTHSTGSLHDELVNRNPSPSPTITTSSNSTIDLRTVRSSRPCYRCISYMHSVGIKRVFWTNDSGEWEGAKVRDLVDALDTSVETAANGGPIGNGLFVTKHEVLMLKRMMGDS